MSIAAPDLTKQPPRSPRVRLGGYCLLPRILDKCRATVAGSNGEYNFNCPVDQQFFAFVQEDAEAFKQEVARGRSDGEMLEWVRQNARSRRTDAAIAAWSEFQRNRTPSDVEGRKFFHDLHGKIAPQRDDIATWFDLLDLDDYVSFGGRP